MTSQTYTNFEVLVVDDGSNPENASRNKTIVTAFKETIYLYKDNTGQPDSRNYGIQKAKGAYIAFCDDDDCWIVNKLQKQIDILKANPEYDIVTGCIAYINEKGNQTGELKCHDGYNHGYVFKHFLVKNRTASITPLLRREVFNKVGLFNADYTIAEDWEFWRRASYYFKFYGVNEVLAYVRLHPEKMSYTKSGEVMEAFVLYRKLTKSLLLWGKNRFSKPDVNLIYKTEWQTYRKMMTNHYSGYLNKIKFLTRVFLQNMSGGLHVLYLMFKYEILNNKKFKL